MAFHCASVATVGDISHYIPNSRLVLPPTSRRLIYGISPNFEDQLLPVTLLVFQDVSEVSAGALAGTVDLYLQSDDVFSRSFLEYIFILVHNQSASLKLDDSSIKVLEEWGTQSVHVVQTESQSIEVLRGGPYFASYKSLRQAWRLYKDTNGAFMFPVVPSDVNSESYVIPATSSIPVPSRLYFDKPSNSKPLSGLRVGIKDNIDLKGVTTSNGNRAFQELYPPRDRSAACVEALIAAGAVIVGKTKTVQFASGENARDWIDFQPSFCPRGDGYQDPAGSSTGSAAAMSSYDWLDLTIGTDTFGSIIGPAADHGLFGLRPSLGVSSTRGVFPVSNVLDTVGFFTRSIKLAATAARILSPPIGEVDTCFASVELLYPTDIWPSRSQEYKSWVEPFLKKFEGFLNTKRKEIDINAMFKNYSGKSLDEYLNNTLAHIQLYDCYHNALPFLQEYQKTYNKKAFADPFIEYKWSLGKDLSKEDYDTALAERNTFGSWVREALLPQPGDGTAFHKILVMPSGDDEPFYRHAYHARTMEEGAQRKQGFGFRNQAISVLAGLPWFTIPIGQFSYISSVTEREEWLPTSIAFIGPRGMIPEQRRKLGKANAQAEGESSLIELLQQFLESTPGLYDQVRTGVTAFPLEVDPSVVSS